MKAPNEAERNAVLAEQSAELTVQGVQAAEKKLPLWEKLLRRVMEKAFGLFRITLSEEKWDALFQFIRFGIVGLTNTLVNYVVYAGLVALGVHYLIASVAGFIVSVLNSFFWNNRYVFTNQEGQQRTWWKVLLKTFCAYGFTGLILNNILLWLLIDCAGMSAFVAPIITLIVTIPLNFLLNKLWAFK